MHPETGESKLGDEYADLPQIVLWSSLERAQISLRTTGKQFETRTKTGEAQLRLRNQPTTIDLFLKLRFYVVEGRPLRWIGEYAREQESYGRLFAGATGVRQRLIARGNAQEHGGLLAVFTYQHAAVVKDFSAHMTGIGNVGNIKFRKTDEPCCEAVGLLFQSGFGPRCQRDQVMATMRERRRRSGGLLKNHVDVGTAYAERTYSGAQRAAIRFPLL
jgi:hypothetical protein